MNFEEELNRFNAELELSPGELLSIAREIAHDDKLRSIDRLTQGERREFLLALEFLRLRVLTPA